MPLLPRAAGALLLALALTMTGCAQENDSTTSQEPVTVEVTLRDGEVSPHGERVEVGVGQPVEFSIDSDVAGEMHVHSTPDHEIAFEPGKTTEEITIDQPGVVEVELHEPEVVVVQLQVQ